MTHNRNHRIRNHLVIHAGFNQDPTDGGANDLWRRARAVFEPDVAVHRLRWNANFDTLADSIKRDSYPNPNIVLAPFSWGAGNGLLRLAKALAGHGLSIDAVVASDPIYHSLFLFTRWLAVSRFQPRIPLPFNVKRLEWFKQDNDPWLRSPGFYSRKYPDRIAEPVVLPGYQHTGMDNASEWHDRVIEVTRQVCFAVKPRSGGEGL